jgi:hypothetical protein
MTQLRMTIADTARHLAPNPGDLSQVFAIVKFFVAAAEAGEIDAEKVAPTRPLPMMWSSRTRVTTPEPEKEIGSNSPVNFADACKLWGGRGHKVPERALELLPEAERARIEKARTIGTVKEGEQAKTLEVLGVVLHALLPKLPPALKHGSGINAAAVVELMHEAVQDENGNLPHGWGKASLETLVGKALKTAEPLIAKPKAKRLGSA